MKQKRFNIVLTLFISFLLLSIPLTFSQTQSNLTYDGNGNLITGDGKYREYNEFNQLIRVREGNSPSGDILETYVYHPTEDRILVKYSDYETYVNGDDAVVYVSDNFERSYDNLGSTHLINETYYVYDEHGIVAEIVYNGSYESTPNYYNFSFVKKLFYHNDHLGSTSVITNNTTGEIIEETFYDPYGNILSGGNVSRYAYEGKEYSQFTEDYDFNFRKYNANIGVFNQPDAVIPNVYDPQSLNRYRFERNNPYKYVDKDGKYFSPADILDYLSLAQSSYQFYKDPSLENFGWLSIDIVSSAIPVFGGVGFFGKAAKYGKGSDLIEASQKIADKIGPATNTISGTIKHREASELLKKTGLKNLYTEVSLKEGFVTSYGTIGSTRIDAITSSQDLSKIGTRLDQSQTKNVIDFKFGESGLTSSQSLRIKQQTGVTPIQIKPRSKPGLFQRIKSFFKRK